MINDYFQEIRHLIEACPIVQSYNLITDSRSLYSGKRLSEIQTKLCLAWFIARETVPHTTAHRYM
ncbi:hypothetical protein myaer87_05320 [Microcystis aeruginosa NIES-87]|nr:hypothetical protein myaer87_05320 [Microcystis aeruginosa NIES-87]